MTVKRWLKAWEEKKQKALVEELIGITGLDSCGLRRDSGEEVLVFLLEPDNLSVLSEAGITRKVYGLMTVLKGLSELELCCVNSKESFAGNRRYLKKRLQEEENPRVKLLLQQELRELEEMEHSRVGSREFLLLLRLNREDIRDLGPLLNRVEKAFREQAIRVRRAQEEDLKRILSVYFTQSFSVNNLEDYDGERWVMTNEENASAAD